ncbi:MAG: preprotein translocase subunit SecY [Planctomycetota bacterium]
MGAFYFALVAESRIRVVLENIFSIPELLKKLIFTLGLLCIYRIGFHIPLPGLDVAQIKELMSEQERGPLGQALQYFSMFTGGSLRQSTLFGLGIMPYISASIIFTLLTTVVPALERLQKEGPAGQKKIQEYTRYATVGLCLVQATFWMKFMTGGGGQGGMVYVEYQGWYSIFLMGVLGLTAGTIFLMWLGEQIDEYGIGNGISLLIMAGIVCRLPDAIIKLISMADLSLIGAGTEGKIGLVKIIFLAGAFVFVVAGAILITQGQRRIPVQQAKQTRGRRVYGGQRQYLPLRINHGGVMPIIFASSLMIFPGVILRYMARSGWGAQSEVVRVLNDAFQMKSVTYSLCYVGLIFFFAYFWTTVQFKPKEMADQLRDYGSFIPGLRPGRRTAEYLERVMERITYCGAAFLALIAVLPQAVAAGMGIPFNISSYLGGTALLIMVSVTLDLVQRIEANLVMRNYGGFLGDSQRIKGAYR